MGQGGYLGSRLSKRPAEIGALLGQLREVTGGGHRGLVFSQFTRFRGQGLRAAGRRGGRDSWRAVWVEDGRQRYDNFNAAVASSPDDATAAAVSQREDK